MVSLKNKKHIFFDLDDTLWDFGANTSKVLNEIFEAYQLNKKLGVSSKEFIDCYAEINLELWSLYYNRQIEKKQMRDVRFQKVFQRFDYENLDESASISETYMKRAPYGTSLKEGCIDTLTYLQKNYQLHIITNGFVESQAIKIDGCGLRPFFKNIIISEEHQSRKPEEKIFRVAEKIANATSQECVMIGDSIESDIKGALNAGWEAVLLLNKSIDDFDGKSIKSLRDLKDIF